jgi:spore germination protein KB
MPQKEVLPKQLKYASANMIIATSILSKQLYTYAENQGWVAITAGVVFCLIMISVYAALAGKFPGFSLIEINTAVFGGLFGKVVSILYVYFFLTIACLNVNVMGNFIQGYVLPNTPMLLIMLVFVIACGYAVRKGPYKLMSYGFVIVFISCGILLLNTLLLVPQLKFRNLLPIFSLAPRHYVLGAHSVAMIPLSDTFFLMMFLPYVKKTEGLGSALRKGMLAGAAFLMVQVLRDTSVLGGMLEEYNMPSHIAVRLIDIGDILTRLDIVFISVIILLLFYKVSILLYATVSGVERILKTGSSRFLVTVFSVLLALYALTVFQSQSEHTQWLVRGAAAVHHTFFVVILPLATWFAAALHGVGNKKIGPAPPSGLQEK